MFFIPFDNWNTLFFMQIYRYPVVWYNRHVAVFFETSALKKSTFYIRYLRHPLYPLSKVQNKASTA